MKPDIVERTLADSPFPLVSASEKIAKLEAQLAAARSRINEIQEELIYRNQERMMIVSDSEVNNIVQKRLETSAWFIGSRGFLLKGEG